MEKSKEAGAPQPPKKGSVLDAPLKPNTLASNLLVTSSTFDHVSFDYCLHNNSTHTGSLFNNTNFSGASFERCSFDGVILQRCSLRGMFIQGCNIEGLVINGIRVGDLIRFITEGRGGE